MPPKKTAGVQHYIVGANETFYQRGLKYDECHNSYENFLKFNAEALGRLKQAIIQVEKGEIELTERCEPTTERGEVVLVMSAHRNGEIVVFGDDCEDHIVRFLKEVPIDHLVGNGDGGASHIIIPQCSGFLVVKEKEPIKGTCVYNKVYDAAGKEMFRYKKGDKKAVCRKIERPDDEAFGVDSGFVRSLFRWRITTCSPDTQIPGSALVFDYLGLYHAASCDSKGCVATITPDHPLPSQARGKKYTVDAMMRYMAINVANKDCPIVLSYMHWDGRFREDLIPAAGRENPPYLAVSLTTWKKTDRSYKKCVVCESGLGAHYCLPSYRIKSIDFGLPNITRPDDLRTAMDLRPNNYHLCYACAHSLDDDVFERSGIVLERFESGGKSEIAVEHLARSGFDYTTQGDNLVLYLGEYRECYAVMGNKGKYPTDRTKTNSLVKVLSECSLDRFPYKITNVHSWTIVPSTD